MDIECTQLYRIADVLGQSLSEPNISNTTTLECAICKEFSIHLSDSSQMPKPLILTMMATQDGRGELCPKREARAAEKLPCQQEIGNTVHGYCLNFYWLATMLQQAHHNHCRLICINSKLDCSDNTKYRRAGNYV